MNHIVISTSLYSQFPLETLQPLTRLFLSFSLSLPSPSLLAFSRPSSLLTCRLLSPFLRSLLSLSLFLSGFALHRQNYPKTCACTLFAKDTLPISLSESKREKQKTMATKQMSLTLLVDEKMKRVIYAESGKDFVETLLSFLTLPLGTVIKLSGKQSKMGSFTMLYQSLEDFDLEFLSTESCKDMLLNPKSSTVELYKNLHPMFDLGATKPTQYYVCSSWKHSFEEHPGNTVENARSRCGKTMNCRIYEEKGVVHAVGGDGVFLKGNMRFMIRDDLQVSVVSSSTCFTLLRELGINDASVLVERKVIVGEDEALEDMSKKNDGEITCHGIHSQLNLNNLQSIIKC